MVNTRSQHVDSYAASSSRMEQNSDNESENSFPEVLSRNQMNEFEDGDVFNSRHNHNSSSVDQRFMEMNRQISDLTSIVMALTEKISSSSNECNGLNTVNNPNVTRSDKLIPWIWSWTNHHDTSTFCLPKVAGPEEGNHLTGLSLA